MHHLYMTIKIVLPCVAVSVTRATGLVAVVSGLAFLLVDQACVLVTMKILPGRELLLTAVDGANVEYLTFRSIQPPMGHKVRKGSHHTVVLAYFWLRPSLFSLRLRLGLFPGAERSDVGSEGCACGVLSKSDDAIGPCFSKPILGECIAVGSQGDMLIGTCPLGLEECVVHATRFEPPLSIVAPFILPLNDISPYMSDVFLARICPSENPLLGKANHWEL